MTREKVYKLIDGERNHQDRLWQEKAKRDSGGVGNYIVVMQTFLNRARDAYSDNEENGRAMEGIRCVAALAVWCMENHETPPR